jgi:hypothetical protein
MATEHNAEALSTTGNGDVRGHGNGVDGEPREKDFYTNGSRTNGNGNTNHFGGDPYHLNDVDMDSEVALRRIRTAGSISISPELFEKIYLSPQNIVKGDLRKTFGNPTPV